MKAKIITLSPAMATELLNDNTQNRKVKPMLKNYVSQMKRGLWRENGEPIIIDKNGVMKDGQHRCLAVIEANFTYNVPLIYDVEPDVMHTIDTGVNRSFADVLELNSYKNTTAIAALTKSIIELNANRSGVSYGGLNRQKADGFNNSVGLDFVKKHNEDLQHLNAKSISIWNKQSVKILQARDIAVYLYLFSKGFNYTDDAVNFMSNICGVIIDQNSATYWIYNKLLKAKLDVITINKLWIKAAIVKTWNVYITNDAPVKFLKVDERNIEKIR